MKQKLITKYLAKVMKAAVRWLMICTGAILAFSVLVATVSAYLAKQVCDAHAHMPHWGTRFTPCLGHYVTWRKLPRFQPGWIISYAGKNGYPSESFFLNLHADLMGDVRPAVDSALMEIDAEVRPKEARYAEFVHYYWKLVQPGTEYSNITDHFGTPYRVTTNDSSVEVEYKIPLPWIPDTGKSGTVEFTVFLTNETVSARRAFRINK